MNSSSDLLEIQTFGRVVFTWRASHRPLTLAPREEALLIYLVHQGIPITRAQLCDLFWPGEAIARARGNLRKLLTDIRKSMGEFVCSSREAVWLNAQPYWFDVHEFERLTQMVVQAESPVRHVDATALLRLAEGIRLYHGVFLANFKQPQSHNFTAWLEQEQRVLHQRATIALTILVDDAIQSAQLAKATAYVRRLLELDPYHEKAHGHFMRLLAHQQQWAAAIEHYQTYVHLVTKELGTTVEEEITTLYRQIRSGVLPALGSGTPAGIVAQPYDPKPRAYQLPNPVTPLIGQRLLLSQLEDYVQNPTVRLITLTGLGGTGKSRVALALATQVKATFTDGVCYVPLEQWIESSRKGLLSEEQCYAALVQTTVEALQLAATAVEITLDQQICTYLHDRNLLLLFDSFDYVVEGAAFLLKLLQAAPSVKIVVTSREVLQLPGELVIQIEGLAWSAAAPELGSAECGHTRRGEMVVDAADASAVQLFTSCAQRHNPTLTFDADSLRQIAEICALVDGNPLAIELAAGVMAHYSYSELHTLLSDDLQALQAANRGCAQRHRSMHHVLEESWLRLSPTEQKTLAQLSALPARFNRATATQVAGVSPSTLISLTTKSMLRADGQGHYQLPHMVQHFARQKRQQYKQVAIAEQNTK